MRCEWIVDDDGEYTVWESACGKSFEFETDGPYENDFKFCPYCGNGLTENPFSKQTIAERGPVPTIEEMCGLLK